MTTIQQDLVGIHAWPVIDDPQFTDSETREWAARFGPHGYFELSTHFRYFHEFTQSAVLSNDLLAGHLILQGRRASLTRPDGSEQRRYWVDRLNASGDVVGCLTSPSVVALEVTKYRPWFEGTKIATPIRKFRSHSSLGRVLSERLEKQHRRRTGRKHYSVQNDKDMVAETLHWWTTWYFRYDKLALGPIGLAIDKRKWNLVVVLLYQVIHDLIPVDRWVEATQYMTEFVKREG